MRHPVSALLLASLLAALPASAALIHGNGLPNHQNAKHSDAAPGSPPGVSADDFTLAEETTIDLFEWWGVYADPLFGNGDGLPPEADDFTIEIYDYSGASPDPTPLYSFNIGHVGRTATGFNTIGYDEYYYSATVTPFTLDAGRYLIGIWNNTPTDWDNWWWAEHSGDGNSLYRLPGGEWADEHGTSELAFTINAPEPGSLLALASLIGFAASRRRI